MKDRPRRVVRAALQIVLPLVVVGLAALAARRIVASRRPPEPRRAEESAFLVRTVEAEAGPVELAVEAQGTVAPRTETVLVSEVEGRVLEVSPALASGGFFEEGEVLLRLDDTDLVLALEEARADVARARRTLEEEEADAELARRDWESLGSEGDPSPLVLREPQLAEARAEVAAAEARLRKAERDVERTRVRGPYPGRVRGRHVDVGTYVRPGGMLATVYAVDWAEIRLPVPDEDLALLDLDLAFRGDEEREPGPAVTLSARFAGAEHRWSGRIVRTEGAIDPGTRTVVLVARVEDPYGRASEGDRPPLLAGLFVDASIQGRRLESAVTLPREALHPGGRVFLLDDGRLAIRDVDVLHADRERAVLARGVPEGARVVVTPIELPVEGMELREGQAEEDER